jgi:hypothetical protein
VFHFHDYSVNNRGWFFIKVHGIQCLKKYRNIRFMCMFASIRYMMIMMMMAIIMLRFKFKKTELLSYPSYLVSFLYLPTLYFCTYYHCIWLSSCHTVLACHGQIQLIVRPFYGNNTAQPLTTINPSRTPLEDTSRYREVIYDLWRDGTLTIQPNMLQLRTCTHFLNAR